MRQKKTGITPEVDAGKQARFDAGHATEAQFRPVAEQMIGDDLSPVTGTIEVGGITLLASFDGLTFDRTTGYEHKLFNAKVAAHIDQHGEPGPAYHWQLEQQLLVSGAQRILFVTSDGTADGAVHCYYTSKPERRAALLAGWAQFFQDLEAYEPPAAPAPAAVAKVVASLPVVFDMRVEGRLVACNLEQYKPAALAYIEAINTELTTDQDFADAQADAKFCRESASKLKLAIEQALGQMGDINAAIGTVREIAGAFDAKGLALEKLVKSEKEHRREAIVMGAASALRQHIDGLNQRLGKPYMPTIPADFGGVIKGKSNLDNMQDAVNTELARAKIAASEIADRIEGNLRIVNAKPELLHLYPDLHTVALKQRDDFEALVQFREAQHRRAEDARLEQERERIRQEEADRLEREAASQRQEAERAAQAAAQVAAQAAIAAAASTVVSEKAVEELQDDLLATGTAVAQVSTEVAQRVEPATIYRPASRAAPAPAAAPRGKPTIKLGMLSESLGFTVTAEFLERLVTHLEDWQDFYAFMDEDGGEIVPQSAIGALRNLTIETAKRAESRVTNLASEGTVFERAKAESSGGLVIPVFITLNTLLFDGLGPQKLHMRLSIDTSGDKPTLSLIYRNREQVHKAMGEEFVVLLRRELEAAGLDAGEVVLGKFHS